MEGRDSLNYMFEAAIAGGYLRSPFVGPNGRPRDIVATTKERLFPVTSVDLTNNFKKKVKKTRTPVELLNLINQSSRSSYKSLGALPPKWVVTKEMSCPIGYAALTYTHIGGEAVETLLDTGASVSAISEECYL